MTKDRLFIFLAAVLVILFAIEILSSLPGPNPDKPAAVSPRQVDITEILTRLEQAGLEPKEAKYYREYNE